jgi:hypothetical protein|tara:strand:- start:649 stop:870 length:222 start_codon:yes stop_codon:yes gene_type:complete
MKEITREQKIETILEWWYEDWEEGDDVSIFTDELIRFHTSEEIPLYKYDEETLNQTYEEIMEIKKFPKGELYE